MVFVRTSTIVHSRMVQLRVLPSRLGLRATIFSCAFAITFVPMILGPGGVASAHSSTARTQSLALASAQPRAVASEQRVIGYSVKGRPITARRYGPTEATRVGVFIGEIHGTERAGIPIVKQLARLGNPEGAAMWIIRTVNPDGHAAGLRKNADGVDLNRNSPHLWKSTARAPDYYPGPSAVSEPETRAYTDFLNVVHPDVVLIYHQAGNGVDSYQAQDPSLVAGLAKRMRLQPKSFDCDGECTGTLTGWFNSTHPGAAITIELPAATTSQQVRRWARAARWSITAANNR